MDNAEKSRRIRHGLAAKFRLVDIDDDIWEILEQGFLDLTTRSVPENVEDLSGIYSRLVGWRRRYQRIDAAHLSERSPSPKQQAQEQLRIRAIDAILANELAASRIVRQLRATLRITRPQMFDPERFPYSSAAAVCPPEFFFRNHIPIFHHASDDATAVWDEERRQMVFTAQVDPPGSQVTYTAAADERPVKLQTHFTLDMGGWIFDGYAWSPSVLWEIAKASNRLAEFCPWTPGQCAFFLITDGPPERGAVTIDIENWDTNVHPFTQQIITLRAPAWVPSESVSQAFRDAQRDLLGGPRRDIDERKLELVAFVEWFRIPNSERIPWRTLLKMWNASQPKEWRYLGTPSTSAEKRITKDYNETKKLLLRSGG